MNDIQLCSCFILSPQAQWTVKSDVGKEGTFPSAAAKGGWSCPSSSPSFPF